MKLKTRKTLPRIVAAIVVAVSGFLTAAPAHAEISPLGTWCGNLVYGMNNSCVASLQYNLNAFGFGLSVDGQFGNNTLAAVKWLQTKAHLQDSAIAVDGQAGSMTISWIIGITGGMGGWPGKALTAGGSSCTLFVFPHPNAQTASAQIIDNSGTCGGVLERSTDGGRTWTEVSTYHVITSGTLTTYSYTDNSGELARACGYAWNGNGTVQGCTIAF
jgi:peptidoglycan hydrolase-like protein with peptidoglycan-binding domain